MFCCNKKEKIDISIIDDFIKKDQLIIFSKTHCPYCIKVKKYFEDLKIEYKSYEIDNGDLSDIQLKALHKKTGVKTYPNIFIGIHNTKGCDNTMKLAESGELLKLLDESGIKYEN